MQSNIHMCVGVGGGGGEGYVCVYLYISTVDKTYFKVCLHVDHSQ